MKKVTRLLVLVALGLSGCGESTSRGDTAPDDGTPAEDPAQETDFTGDLPSDHLEEGGGETVTDPVAEEPQGEPGLDPPLDEAVEPAADTAPDPDMNMDSPLPDVPDVVPDSSCTTQGCRLGLGGACCPGLIPERECDPLSGCADLFCINCGDGKCDPHENCYNCIEDCDEAPCTVGDHQNFPCSLIETHDCTCAPSECPPECRHVGTDSEGWYDSCTGDRIKFDTCGGCTASCGAICSRSEGWYSSCSGFIAYAFCTPKWNCSIIF